MNELVTVVGHQVVTSSRSVAENFEKRHDHVLRDIKNLIESADKKDLPKIGEMFAEGTEPDAYGREQKVCYMNWKGFSLLVMGFTGAKAISWKLKYADAFEAMYKQLSVPQLEPRPRYQTRMIGTAVKDIGKTADAIEQVFAVKHGMALASAMEMIGGTYGIDLTPLKGLLPAEERPSYLNATMLAERLGVLYKSGKPNAAEVNKRLETLGLQKKEAKDWRLTEKGRAYGEEMPYVNNGHSGYRIIWNERVFEALKAEATA